MMGGRRMRKLGRGNINNETILPLRFTHLSNTLSCCYCDFKTTFFNQPLFRFGRKHSRWLRVWFSVGIGFSLCALLGVTMVLLWELGWALHVYNGSARLSNLLSGSLFGVPSSISGMSISLPDVGYMCISTVLSVLIHECGHALAAASEGIQVEYIAVFLAVIFPGALVAFNHELLQSLTRLATLRVYCAGIWHNAAFCAACALALFLLPLVLCPFYIHGESLMVLEVSSASPLSAYLSPGDLIFSLDGIHIHDLQDWREMIAKLNEQALQNLTSHSDLRGSITVNGRKGYCTPYSLIEESKDVQLESNQTKCPSELSAFAELSCLDSSTLDNGSLEDKHQKRSGSIHCLDAKDIVKLKKCGDGWAKPQQHSGGCLCSEGDSCLAPVESVGLAWVEITYISSSLPRCWGLMKNSTVEDEEHDLREMSCLHTFVFIGDVNSVAQSLYLTSYQPRWSLQFGLQLPNMLEKLLMCAFQVSLTLALLNSLPVYFLDGESILEVLLQYWSLLSPRKRGTVVQSCLLGGTVICVLVLLRILLGHVVGLLRAELDLDQINYTLAHFFFCFISLQNHSVFSTSTGKEKVIYY